MRIAALVLTSALLVACGAGSPQTRDTSAKIGPFRQAAVERCLQKEKVAFISFHPRSELNSQLRAFPGVTGELDILASLGTPPPGVSYGPSIDSGQLVFEQTAREAQDDVSDVYAVIHQADLQNLSAGAERSVQSTRGNVIVFWDYPNKHPALSMKLVEKCTPATNVRLRQCSGMTPDDRGRGVTSRGRPS